MSSANGLALILFGEPEITRSRTKGGTRGGTRGGQFAQECDVESDVRKFEIFLAHCTFVLESSESRKTVPLTANALDQRPNDSLLPHVERAADWKVILSRYRFDVQPSDVHVLQQELNWTLKLQAITTTADFTYKPDLEEYITSVVCFPQRWLAWIDNAWFLANVQRYWFMQEGDTFGIPSVQSTRKNEFSDCADGRHYFRICNVPNTETTAISEGATALDVSDERLFSGYTDHSKGIFFPENGVMYVILFDIPSEYRIARKEVVDLRECVLCGDERPHNDLGLVFGVCGHYVCYDCCREYKDKLEVKKCFYCRQPTNVKMHGFEHEPTRKRIDIGSIINRLHKI
jgi:hypothetical protein